MRFPFRRWKVSNRNLVTPSSWVLQKLLIAQLVQETIHKLTDYFSKISISTVLPSTLLSSNWPLPFSFPSQRLFRRHVFQIFLKAQNATFLRAKDRSVFFFFWQVIAVVFKYAYIKKRLGLHSTHNFYHTCKNSYMFRLYIYSHHQAGYRNLNTKIIITMFYCILLHCVFIVFIFKVLYPTWWWLDTYSRNM